MNTGQSLVLVAAISAVAGSSVTLLVASAMSPPPAVAPAPSSAAGGDPGLADVVRELAAIRREIAALQVPAGPAPSEGSPRPVAAPAPIGGAASQASAPPPVAVPEAARAYVKRQTEMYSKNADGDFDVAAEAKRRWMLRSEREVLDWFGPPSRVEISSDSDQETWRYPFPEGAAVGDRTEFSLRVHAGRVVDVW